MINFRVLFSQDRLEKLKLRNNSTVKLYYFLSFFDASFFVDIKAGFQLLEWARPAKFHPESARSGFGSPQPNAGA